MKAHEAIIRLLHDDGVDTVFTLMSEDTMAMMSRMESEWADQFRLIKTRHEQGAVAMADGYARTGDDIGVCLVGRGPAVSQTGNGLVTARKKGSNVLLVVPESPLSDGYDVKEFEQETYLQSTVGSVVSIRSHDTLVRDFREALRRVRVADGPLAVQIPWDILDGDMDVPASFETNADTVSGANTDTGVALPCGTVTPRPDLVSQAVDTYVESDAFQPPIILAGRGAVEANAKAELEELARRTSGLLATSLQGRNLFADHPYYLGFTGSWGTNVANEYASEANVVFAVGASLNPYTIDEGHVFGEETQVIHVDRDPVAIGRYADTTLGIQGDARETVRAINEELERRDIDREGELWSDQLAARLDETSPMNDETYPDVPETMDPRDLVRELNDLLPAAKKVVADGGHFTRWVLDGIQTPPEDFTFTLDFASIGLGLPVGIGTAVASEDKPCVTVCGDAGFMMSMQELETAIRNDVSMTIIVMNDSSLNSEYHSLDVAGNDPEVALVPAPDIADVAESLGAEGHTVRSRADLTAIADRLGAEPDGQLVVDCKLNHHVRHRSKV
ncbi:thiamine pyrophosphate-binding protein [Salinadaptatus halalkaliphilus]|uniref:Thiamine pyrophosphate-binding protein n=1 Tax=Salinadaptatus halalkaliphilus TaxID=2419781 RepID=A0A4S3THP6_9EURY|nr:thiamine pyrophosphate-binding protein [Salinadaptatus halalkaliphilus]THE63509.1 thiamine pyrophosphate-binding protein [Salinadaptatus halalkaliphilus]